MSATSGSGNLLDDLRNHLVDRGIVRSPKTPGPAGGGQPYPLFLEPKVGAPGPGELRVPEDDPKMMITALLGTEIKMGPYESWTYRPTVTFVYRAGAKQGGARLIPVVDGLLRNEFEDRRAWTTTRGLQVIESGIFVPLARLGADERAYTSQTEYWFQLYSGRAPRG